MNSIPVDQLQNKTSISLQIKFFRPEDNDAAISQIAHRDDHYVFFLLTSGSGSLKVDAQEVIVTGNHLYYILPTQVHYRIKTDQAEGWFLAVDTSLIPPELRDVFEHRSNLQVPCMVNKFELKQYSDLLNLLHKMSRERKDDKYYLQIIHNLCHTFLAMVASSYQAVETMKDTSTRSAELTRLFRDLLTTHSHTIKSPSQYASILNVSLGHLNETIKKATGSPVSYWIGQEILSEAKRLLNYTDASVKQIAHELGYADPAYFIRFFRKMSGLSPLRFRRFSQK
ncbi:helix-turn-helix domain-containing protein [Pedobacter miscanthi]|uniref:helix-turn-helix domain-containing protein n=1 Tax=Pedobacter miscanthi TaxID=2259170 RepID=UPI00292D1FD4|nr:helix-turn-helix domain-containing protein [Pedobacter miscanthi]